MMSFLSLTRSAFARLHATKGLIRAAEHLAQHLRASKPAKIHQQFHTRRDRLTELDEVHVGRGTLFFEGLCQSLVTMCNEILQCESSHVLIRRICLTT